MHEINETHDPELESWVESANDPDSDFPIQNLPFCVFSSRRNPDMPRVGIAIGDKILDLWACYGTGSVDAATRPAVLYSSESSLNRLAQERDACRALRKWLSKALSTKASDNERKSLAEQLVNIADCTFYVPADIGDYTDFYCSIFHATNVGSMFRPDNPLMPNYKYLPVGYHGRSSSIVISGTEIRRPKGQNRSDAERPPVFIPCKNLDYEIELGFYVGTGNELGSDIKMGQAEDHIFGVCLVNDWSARDIQAWEYQPLGPFLAKNFATTVSPFVVTMEALAPFRVPAFERAADDPAPLDHLYDEDDRRAGGLDIILDVYIRTEKMRQQGLDAFRLSRSNTKDLYWTIGQMLTHHASNGCNLRPGDLLASGTVSGPDKHSRGCLLELTWRGTEPLVLPSGEERRFLEDGDEVIMTGHCMRDGYRRIGLGECRGTITPAQQ